MCETEATLSEIRGEAAWAVQGTWMTIDSHHALASYWKASLPPVASGSLSFAIRPGQEISPPLFFFHHLYSGLRREQDLEWYLLRAGGAAGLRIVVRTYDVGYGPEFDLLQPEVLERLHQEIRAGRGDGAHSGAPCSTWSRARFRPNGPPPLRTRDRPWGLPRLSAADRKKVDQHSALLVNGLECLELLAELGAPGTAEHPEDPGRAPFPSIWATELYQSFEKKAHYVRISFPQCAFEADSEKPTTLAYHKLLDAEKRFAGLRCTHAAHVPLIGKDADGKFLTRTAQSYPPRLCEQLALMFVEHLSTVRPRGGDPVPGDDEDCVDIGTRVLCPEIGPCWDPAGRWRELARWPWRAPEHINVLEARGEAAKAKLPTELAAASPGVARMSSATAAAALSLAALTPRDAREGARGPMVTAGPISATEEDARVRPPRQRPQPRRLWCRQELQEPGLRACRAKLPDGPT